MTQMPRHIEIAMEYGIIQDGRTLEDYLMEAVENNGYETICIWGVQGSGKSNRALQMSYWIYKDWAKVLDNIVFKPSEIVERLEALPDNKRISCLVWDDVGVHYPSSKFKTDIQEYEAIDATWAAIRTKVAVVILTIPLITRLAKNLRDNITFEVFLGRNQKEMMKRVFHLPGLDSIQTNFFKITVEWPSKFDLYKVPPGVWRDYWAMRIRLANEAIATLKGATNMDNLEGFMPVKDAATIAKLNPNTLQQAISRGVYRGRKINGLLHILLEDLNQYLEGKGIEAVEYTPHTDINKYIRREKTHRKKVLSGKQTAI